MFRFETCADLSDGVIVKPLYPNYNGDEKDMELYSQDMSAFIAFWMREVYDQLNGFNGFDSVKWSLLKL